MKKVFLVLALAALCLASCSKDKEADTLAKQMLGKWMTSEFNGNLLPTNNKVVYTIVSTTEGFISASRIDYNSDHEMWTDHAPSSIELEGSMITLYGSIDKTTRFVAILDVKSIDDNKMVTESTNRLYRNGALVSETSGTVTWVKVKDDYSEAILGLWEGHATSGEGSVFDDGKPHRWQYNNDGTYVYYSQDADGNWQPQESEFEEYFVDGTLLCTRWKNTGDGEEECREWWEIVSIGNGVMNWTALRQRDDGTTFNATFSMTKVNP